MLEGAVSDVTFDNAALVNFQPYTVVDIDATNSSSIVSAALQATASTEVLGVCYDQAKLNPAGAVQPNSAIAVRIWGIAQVAVNTGASITAGGYVAVATSGGLVGPASHTAGGSAPAPIVGRALTTIASAAAGDRILVLLMVGARY
jgi:hypothetical protein